MEGYKHVIVSALRLQDGAETFIFGSDDKGVVLNWSQLPGSSWELLTPKEIFASLGYDVIIEDELH